MNLAAALSAVAPSANAALWVPLLTASMRSSGIITPHRAAAFLGQCAHESAGFTQLSEDLNYSARRLTEIWPSRFPSLIEAARYSQRPQALGNHVYAGRMDNGDEASGDGYRFRGGGVLQLTGRANYTAFAKDIGMSPDDAASYVRLSEGASRSACWVWNRLGLNALADVWDIPAITRRINGGELGLADREELCGRALAILAADTNDTTSTEPQETTS